MPSDLVDLALRRRTNAQHRCRTARNLRAASIVDHLGAESEAHSLCLEHEHVLFGVDLESDLGLAETLPALEDRVCGICTHEGLVACEGGVRALCCNFA